MIVADPATVAPPRGLACDPLSDVTQPSGVLAQCLDALPHVVTVLNAAGRVLFQNRMAYRYFGPRIGVLRWPDERDHLFHPDDKAKRAVALEKVLKQAITVRTTLRAIRHDYAPRWQVCELTPLFGKNAVLAGAQIVMWDVHDRRHDWEEGGPDPRS